MSLSTLLLSLVLFTGTLRVHAEIFELDRLFTPLPHESAWLFYQHSSVLGGQVSTSKESHWKFAARLNLFDVYGNSLGSCTGSAIAPQVVLTAAHCLELGDTKIGKIVLSFNDYSSGKLIVHERETRLFRAHPDFVLVPEMADASSIIDENGRITFDERGYNSKKLQYESYYSRISTVPFVTPLSPDSGPDIGVVYFSKPLPSVFKALSLYEGEFSSDLAAGAKVLALGYGLYGLNIRSGDDQLRHTQLKIVGLVRNQERVDLLTFSPASRGLAFGDSGGPTILEKDGAVSLLGINSSSFFNGHSTQIVPNLYAKWIADVVAELITQDRKI